MCCISMFIVMCGAKHIELYPVRRSALQQLCINIITTTTTTTNAAAAVVVVVIIIIIIIM